MIGSHKKSFISFLSGLTLSLWVLPVFADDNTVAGALDINIDSRNPQFSVQLPSNPSTGFQWKLTKYDTSLFKLASTHYIVPATKRIGASGKMNYFFMLIKGKKYPQSSSMSFTYSRAWEPNSGVGKVVTLHFTDNP